MTTEVEQYPAVYFAGFPHPANALLRFGEEVIDNYNQVRRGILYYTISDDKIDLFAPNGSPILAFGPAIDPCLRLQKPFGPRITCATVIFNPVDEICIVRKQLHLGSISSCLLGTFVHTGESMVDAVKRATLENVDLMVEPVSTPVCFYESASQNLLFVFVCKIGYDAHSSKFEWLSPDQALARGNLTACAEFLIKNLVL